jgi:diphthamide synthase (EF-2-diphthine--ammonia ligase)
VRQYREGQLAGSGITPLFLLWGHPTVALAEEMLDAGVEAYVSSVDLKVLPASFAGRCWSRALLEALPAGVDPCGENGEIHTIVVAGPMFAQRIPVDIGEIVERDGFAYADVIPIGGGRG